MTANRHGSAHVEFPNDLEIVLTREFDAPVELVFDVLTKPEHVIKTIAPYGEEVRVCSIDLRVGGNYHFVFVAEDGREMSFRGTFLEVEPPTRTAQTWIFDGWPDVEAVESTDLHETDGVTKLTYRLAFRDRAGRDHMTKTDGLAANFDNVEDLLRSLLRPAETTPGRHGPARIEFPSDLEVVFTREFRAPIELVFDVLTKPEHVRKWGATPPDQMTECSIDLRVGGNYHHVFVTADGTECSFRGTYLEIEPPIRTVETWLFEGWPDAEAVETVELHEADGVTTLTMRLAFRDKAGRDHMTRFDGQQESFDAMEDILRSLVDPAEAVSD